MKYLIIIALLFFAFSPYAQERPAYDKASTAKGVSPLPAEASAKVGTSTYAVVVGISDYQDKDIPDLRFADKDALAFAGFLQSPAGGSLDEDHLKVLINEKATEAQFGAALDWLWEVAGENDKVIIYFSGHGDVERKSITQPGYLLCWDALPSVYMGGGAFNVRDLNDVVSTISIQNKAKVMLVTDACRAGKLSGSGIGGAQATAANLAKQYGNEIKILSCQPDEYSIEGEQWGGGRGAFSYHLLDGLYGMADGNADNTVNLKELGRYLEDRVSAEVAPQNQNPMVIGGVTEKLTDVFPEILAQLLEGKKGQLPMFTATESRGIEDDVLAAADSNVVEMYFAFQKALADKQFLFAEKGRPENDYADAWYEQLIKEPSLERLHSSMRRNYAAALQDDSQQVMNNWMKTSQDKALEAESGENQGRLPKKFFTEKVRAFPACLERAAELLGSNHYMYAILQARKHFFEGYLLANSDRYANKELSDKALAEFRQALVLQPELPQAYWQMIGVYGYNLQQPDSAELYAQKAMELYPSWVTPYIDLAFIFSYKYMLADRAKPYLEKAIQIDSSSVPVLNAWGDYYEAKKQYFEAEQQYKRAIQLDSTFVQAYNNLGFLYEKTNRYAEAEQQYKSVIQLDATDADAYIRLGYFYYKTDRYAEAEQQFKSVIQLDSTDVYAYRYLGLFYEMTDRHAEAEQQYKSVIQLDATDADAYRYLGLFYYETDRYAEAEQQYKKAIRLDSTNAKAYGHLGELYAGTRRYDLAEQQYKKAIQLAETGHVEDIDFCLSCYFNNLGLVYSNTLRYGEAEEYLKKAIQLDSASAKAYISLGSVYRETLRNSEAEEYLIKAIQLDSASVTAYISLGLVYVDTRRYDLAEKQYKKCIRLDSTNWVSYANLGVVYQIQGKWEASEAVVKKAIQFGPPIGALVSMLGNAYTNMSGRMQEAKELLDKGFGMSPDSPDVHIFLAEWYLKNNQLEQAWDYFERGLEKGVGNEALNFTALVDGPFLGAFKKEARWEELMQKHFPDQNKK